MTSSNNRIEMAVDTTRYDDSSPLFMMIGCLSPSRDEAEPPTKILEQVESPKCASLLAFSHDEDDDFHNENISNHCHQSFVSSTTASSVGLMASGLAWVRSQKPRSPRYGSSSSPSNTVGAAYQSSLYNDCRFIPIEQQLRERLEQQKRLDRINSLASSNNTENQNHHHYATPSRNQQSKSKVDPTTTATTTELDKLQIQSCPASPSFMSRVYSNLTRIPLSSNNSISNGSTNSTSSIGSISNSSSTSCGPAAAAASYSPGEEEKKEDESPPPPSSQQRTQLTPRLTPVNNIYSFSNIIAATPRTTTPNDSTITPSTPTPTPTSNTLTANERSNVLQPPQPTMQIDTTITTPRSYFCQEEDISPSYDEENTSTSKSPTRSSLINVLARIGSGENPPESSSLQPGREGGGGDDENDSILDDDEEEAEEDDDEDDIHGVSWIPPVRCVAEPRESGEGCAGPTANTSSILSPQQMHQIARHVLPKGIASCQWKRLYSLVRDGDSFDVCLHYAQRDARTLLVIRTTRGAILGGYAGDVWQTKAGEGYYGTSDTCLFTFQEKKTCADDDEDFCCENVDPRHVSSFSSSTTTCTSKDGLKTPNRPPTRSHGTATVSAPLTPQSPPLVRRPKKSLLDQDSYEASLPPIQVYRYTGVNRYIQYCDANKQMMAFGGGGEDGSFGLCVEQEFQGGSTGPCDTFDNEPLCDQENFKIVDVELWGFLTGQF